MSVTYFDIEELLSDIYDISDEKRNEGFDFDELLWEQFEVSFENFSEIIEMLLPLTPVVESPLTGDKYHAFINKDGLALIKQLAEVSKNDKD